MCGVVSFYVGCEEEGGKAVLSKRSTRPLNERCFSSKSYTQLSRLQYMYCKNVYSDSRKNRKSVPTIITVHVFCVYGMEKGFRISFLLFFRRQSPALNVVLHFFYSFFFFDVVITFWGITNNLRSL